MTIICRRTERNIAEFELKLISIQFKGIIPSSPGFKKKTDDFASILGYDDTDMTFLFEYYLSYSKEELFALLLKEKKLLNALLLQQAGKFHHHIDIDLSNLSV